MAEIFAKKQESESANVGGKRVEKAITKLFNDNGGNGEDLMFDLADYFIVDAPFNELKRLKTTLLGRVALGLILKEEFYNDELLEDQPRARRTALAELGFPRG